MELGPHKDSGRSGRSLVVKGLDLNANVACRNSLMTAQQTFKGALIRVCGNERDTADITPVSIMCYSSSKSVICQIS